MNETTSDTKIAYWIRLSEDLEATVYRNSFVDSYECSSVELRRWVVGYSTSACEPSFETNKIVATSSIYDLKPLDRTEGN